MLSLTQKALALRKQVLSRQSRLQDIRLVSEYCQRDKTEIACLCFLGEGIVICYSQLDLLSRKAAKRPRDYYESLILAQDERWRRG